MEIPVIINHRAYTQGKNILHYWDYVATSISNQFYAQLEYKKNTDSAWSIAKERYMSKSYKFDNLDVNSNYSFKFLNRPGFCEKVQAVFFMTCFLTLKEILALLSYINVIIKQIS